MDNLKTKLKRLGITLREIADASEQSESTICLILNDTLRSRIILEAENLIEQRKEEIKNG